MASQRTLRPKREVNWRKLHFGGNIHTEKPRLARTTFPDPFEVERLISKEIIKNEKMAGYKLSYFNIMGRAEVSRLLFAVADEVYEDDRFMHDEWPTRKLEAPFGQVPILTVNGKKINQSLAIHKYLARAFGLYGKYNMENTMCDIVMESAKDVIDEMTKWYFEKDLDRKKDFEEKLNDITYPKLVDFLDKMLKDNGGQWLVGDMLTVADLACFDILDQIIPRADNDIFQSTPSLKEHYKKVMTHPRVQAWLEKRPKTEI